MTTLDRDYQPPWAVTCWVDAYAIYIKINTKAEPYITSFQLSEGGLSKALHFLKEIHKERAGGKQKVNGVSKTHSLIKRKPVPTEAVSDEQREKVRELLRKRGLI